MLSAPVRELLLKSISLNSTAFEGDVDGEQTFIGSKTETAMLIFAYNVDCTSCIFSVEKQTIPIHFLHTWSEQLSYEAGMFKQQSRIDLLFPQAVSTQIGYLTLP